MIIESRVGQAMAGRHAIARRGRRARSWAALVVVASTTLLGLTTLALAPPGNAYDPSRNILANWQFSSPSVASGSIDVSAGSPTISGWSVTSGTVDLVSGAGVRAVLNGASPQAVDLNGTSPGAISQTFATVPGYTYSGDYFLVSATAATAPVTKTATLTLNATTTPISYDSANTNGWLQQSFRFTATGSTSTITFASSTPGADGPLITDVEVYPPYPLFLDPVHDVVLYQDQPGGADGYYSVSAENPNEGRGRAYTVACDHPSGSVFPVGTTTVTCTFAEPEGPTASETLTVTVLGAVYACSGVPFGSPASVAAHPVAGANVVTTPCVTAAYRPDKPTIISLLPALQTRNSSVGPSSIEIDGIQATSQFFRSAPFNILTLSSATLGSVTVTLFGFTYTVTNLSSEAEANLGYDHSTLNAECSTASVSGSTSVGSLVINGKSTAIDGSPYTLDLGLATVHFNQHVVVGNTITERAMFIDLPGTSNDIAIAQSVAGANCTG